MPARARIPLLFTQIDKLKKRTIVNMNKDRNAIDMLEMFIRLWNSFYASSNEEFVYALFTVSSVTLVLHKIPLNVSSRKAVSLFPLLQECNVSDTQAHINPYSNGGTQWDIF